MTIALIYTILSGNTLTSIADGINACAGVTYQEIESLNNATTTDLSPGEKLEIPVPNTTTVAMIYTVQPGDSYYLIASNLAACVGVTVQEIGDANPQVNPNALQVGGTVGIPATPEVSSQPLVPAANIGYWDWTWAPSAAPAGVTIGFAFSGYTDPTDVLSNSNLVGNSLQGTKYVTFGGGNSLGSFTASLLTSINNAISAGTFAAYQGIAYDVESGDSGLEDAFEASFQLAKSNGFQVLVTVSHSAPYGISDAQTLMTSFFTSAYIDFLSPQLYTSGNETANDYTTTAGVTWNQYASAKALIIPSIVSTSLYPDAQATFATYDVTTAGYIRWNAS
jgi:LysM repeat protein